MAFQPVLSIRRPANRRVAPRPSESVRPVYTYKIDNPTGGISDALAAKRRLADDIHLPVPLGINASGDLLVTGLDRLPHLAVTGSSREIRRRFVIDAAIFLARALKGGRDVVAVIGPDRPESRLIEKTADAEGLPVADCRGLRNAVAVLSDLAAECDRSIINARSARILQPVGRLSWDAPSQLEGAVSETGLNAEDESSLPALIRRSTRKESRRIVVIESVAGIVWSIGAPAIRAIETLLRYGPEAGIHVIASAAILQVPPFGRFVDHNIGGHCFFSDIPDRPPLGFLSAPGAQVSESFRIRVEPEAATAESSAPDESVKLAGFDFPDPDRIARLLSRPSFRASKITSITNGETEALNADIINAMIERRLVVRLPDGRLEPVVPPGEYLDEIKQWLYGRAS